LRRCRTGRRLVATAAAVALFFAGQPPAAAPIVVSALLLLLLLLLPLTRRVFTATPKTAAAAEHMHLATIPVLSGITAVLSNV
jgi:uncharacterized protein (DUF58 family)